jgi:hypothetical protein
MSDSVGPTRNLARAIPQRRVIELFYSFTVADPAAFFQPWTVERLDA